MQASGSSRLVNSFNKISVFYILPTPDFATGSEIPCMHTFLLLKKDQWFMISMKQLRQPNLAIANPPIHSKAGPDGKPETVQTY
jgi:hypothetical protein